MSKSGRDIVAVVIAAHGLIHLMGVAAYLKLFEMHGLGYKTTLLHGQWDLGERGIFAFGVLWALPAAGFAVAAVALLSGWSWGPSLLLVVTLLSLALTGLDWNVAFAGLIVNVAIITMLWLGMW